MMLYSLSPSDCLLRILCSSHFVSFVSCELALDPQTGHLVLHLSIRLMIIALLYFSPFLVADHAAQGYCEWGFIAIHLRIVISDYRRGDLV